MPLTVPARLLSLLVRGYRFWLKPWLGNACRFTPSCSEYALQALDDHGAARGSLLTAGRLLRCHPWCDGGHDPVPKPAGRRKGGLFTSLLQPGRVPSADSPTPNRKTS